MQKHYDCDCDYDYDYDNDKKQDTKSVLQSWVWFKLFWICLATIPPLLKDAKYTNGMGPKLYCRWNAKLYEYNSNSTDMISDVFIFAQFYYVL